MKKYQAQAPGVWIPQVQFPSISSDDLSSLDLEAQSLPRKRSRVCVHSNSDDRMQEMFIAFSGDSYIRPSYHHNKDESIHFIEGNGKYIFFRDDGSIEADVRLGNYKSDLPFYLRVPANKTHTLIPMSEKIIAHEVTQGPFEKQTTHFPEWAINDDDEFGKARFFDEYSYAPVSGLKPLRMERISEEAYQCKDELIYLRRTDIDRLKEDVPLTKRKRIRVLIHPTAEHSLHEMFVVYTKATYVRPNLHIGKDESLHILEGEADFVFFDENGVVIAVIELSAEDKNKDFFIRVPQGVYHTIVMRSEMLVIHESTPGPFVPSDTVWAQWAPADSDAKACEIFCDQLEAQMSKFIKKK